MPSVPAIVHTDIQGSTRLWERLGPAFAGVLAEHNRILRAAARAGREVMTEGDSFTFAFTSASDAVTFALTAQEALHLYPWPSAAGEILVRIGVHAGEVPEGGDAAGTLGARARLVAAAAHGGQVLLTAEARERSDEALAGAVVADLGDHRLAAHDRPQRIFQVLPRSLASRSFPPPNTLSARPSNLAIDHDRFVGRRRDLDDLAALVPSPAGRLVTITGPGGMGKSRLARELAIALLPKFEGGCWFADLSEAHSVADVARAAANALGVPLPAGEDPAATVADALEFRKPLLLILDGFEALVEHASATVGLWNKRARHARILVTSISLLGLSGEREVALGPLPTPDRTRRATTAAEVESFEAARLFLDRAARVRPDFSLTDANAAAVGRICTELEGIPLAIELAAARLAELDPDQMLREIESQPAIHDAPAAGARSRQSLAGTLEWSYGLLNAWQTSAFHQVCVFRGGFYLESAEDVIDLSGVDEAPFAIDAVQALRDRSLLRTSDTPFGTRFSMFRSVRDFGERRGRAIEGETAWRALEDRHSRHFVEAARRWAALTGPGAAEALEHIDLELDNIFAIQDRCLARAAAGEAGAAAEAARAIMAADPLLSWRGPFDQRISRLRLSLDAGDPAEEARVAAALVDACVQAGHIREADEVLSRGELAASRSGSRSLVARLKLSSCRILLVRQHQDKSVVAASEAERIFREEGNAKWLSRALDFKAGALRMLGRFDEALAAAEEGLALARGTQEAPEIIRTATNLGSVHQARGNPSLVFPCLDEAERHLGIVGSRNMAARISGIRGMAWLDAGDPDRAAPFTENAVAVARELGQKQSLLTHTNNLGRVRRGQRRSAEARAAFEEARRLATELGDNSMLAMVQGNDAMVLSDEGDFEGALRGFTAAAEAANRMNLRNSYAIYRGNVGIILGKMGRNKEALDPLRESMAIYGEIGVEKSLRAFNVLQGLSDAELAAGNDAAATEAAKKATSAAEALGLERGPSARLAEEAKRMRERAAPVST
ncbi:MAG: hypothetical protein K8T20_10890 [Planctomycetes bacterium]|nr:hypothetical protein [Planctomycetota bacterium]